MFYHAQVCEHVGHVRICQHVSTTFCAEKLIASWGDGMITVSEFCKGLQQLKGAARAIDMVPQLGWLVWWYFLSSAHGCLGLPVSCNFDLLVLLSGEVPSFSIGWPVGAHHVIFMYPNPMYGIITIFDIFDKHESWTKNMKQATATGVIII